MRRSIRSLGTLLNLQRHHAVGNLGSVEAKSRLHHPRHFGIFLDALTTIEPLLHDIFYTQSSLVVQSCFLFLGLVR